MPLKAIAIALVGLGFAFAQISSSVAIPNSPAGLTFRAWLDAFNSGDRKQMEAFLLKYQPGKPEALDQMIDFREMSGGFELLGIDKSEPLHLEFRVKERGSETTASGQLDVKAGDPAVIDQMRMHARPPGSSGKAEDNIPPPQLDAATRSRVIDGAITNLNESYVFPETAKKMEESLRAHQKRGDYDSITSGEAFADLLTTQLREVSHDKHLGVKYSPMSLPAGQPGADFDDKARFEKQMEQTNCGFETAERLAGNIGYLKFNVFADPQICASTAIAAMNFLANTSAIIFDLRSNGGGRSRDGCVPLFLSVRGTDAPKRSLGTEGRHNTTVLDSGVCSR